jgi:hypothetical protein
MDLADIDMVSGHCGQIQVSSSPLHSSLYGNCSLIIEKL